MEHHRLRKYRGPETWARVRAAYIAGESGPSVARRFDVGYANLRRRARLEGWTRRDIAEQIDLRPLRGGEDDLDPRMGLLADLNTLPEPPHIPPKEAVAKAVLRAAWLISRGEAEAASTLLRAAAALQKLRYS